VRVIATSWSDNPRKGAATFGWLARAADPARFEFTFVGRASEPLVGVRVVPPVDSSELANLLRQHDVYVAASLADPCSNAVLEGLACGLPVLYARSGGHPEIVGDAGLGFDDKHELPELLDQLVQELPARRRAIAIPTLAGVADRYLDVLGLTPMP
jgi:glycosyltransferase involved in cell wall biosynthesis